MDEKDVWDAKSIASDIEDLVRKSPAEMNSIFVKVQEECEDFVDYMEKTYKSDYQGVKNRVLKIFSASKKQALDNFKKNVGNGLTDCKYLYDLIRSKVKIDDKESRDHILIGIGGGSVETVGKDIIEKIEEYKKIIKDTYDEITAKEKELEPKRKELNEIQSNIEKIEKDRYQKLDKENRSFDEKEKKALKDEVQKLDKQLEGLKKSEAKIEKEITSITGEIEKLRRTRKEAHKKLDDLKKEFEEGRKIYIENRRTIYSKFSRCFEFCIKRLKNLLDSIENKKDKKVKSKYIGFGSTSVPDKYELEKLEEEVKKLNNDVFTLSASCGLDEALNKNQELITLSGKSKIDYLERVKDFKANFEKLKKTKEETKNLKKQVYTFLKAFDSNGNLLNPAKSEGYDKSKCYKYMDSIASLNEEYEKIKKHFEVADFNKQLDDRIKFANEMLAKCYILDNNMCKIGSDCKVYKGRVPGMVILKGEITPAWKQASECENHILVKQQLPTCLEIVQNSGFKKQYDNNTPWFIAIDEKGEMVGDANTGSKKCINSKSNIDEAIKEVTEILQESFKCGEWMAKK